MNGVHNSPTPIFLTRCLINGPFNNVSRWFENTKKRIKSYTPEDLLNAVKEVKCDTLMLKQVHQDTKFLLAPSLTK